MKRKSAMQEAALEAARLEQNCIDPGLNKRIETVIDLNTTLLNHEIMSLQRLVNNSNDELPPQVGAELKNAIDLWREEREQFERIQERIVDTPVCR